MGVYTPTPETHNFWVQKWFTLASCPFFYVQATWSAQWAVFGPAELLDQVLQSGVS
jgi:hypothetical protein